MPAPGIFMHTSTRQQKLTDDGAANRESLPCPIAQPRTEKLSRKAANRRESRSPVQLFQKKMNRKESHGEYEVKQIISPC
jgi:hypothetical protein